MSLPKLEHPVYILKIPSTGKEVKFRPFLVKEEKIIMIALQEKSEKVIFNCISEIIHNCTFGKVVADDLTVFDTEYIFLELRKKSKGTEVPLIFQCRNEVDGEPCGNMININFNLDLVKLHKDEHHTNKIMIDDQIGIVMKYPKLKDTVEMESILSDEGNADGMYESLMKFVDCFFEGDTVIDSFTLEEFKEFVDNMSEAQIQKVKDFFTTMPRLRAEIDITCNKCGKTEKVVLEGLQSFL